MIVVSDTSVLCYLVLLGHVNIIKRRFGSVSVPPEVVNESTNPLAPALLRAFFQQAPDWLVVEPAPLISILGLDRLDPGEAAAIRLVIFRRAEFVLIDERQGRRVAEQAGLRVIGTLGLIADAAERGWLDFDNAIRRLLTETNFRVSSEVVAAVRQRISNPG